MPFGLNDAARAFTKAMKHPVAKIRVLGFKVLVYLDDSILAAQTRPLHKKRSQFLVSSEARLQNKLRKIQSDSITNKRMVRLCHQFKENDDFFTPEKNRQSDKESPGSQTQNESLLREISQSLGLCNSSKPAVLQAPLHYRSLQRLLIRNLKKFLNPYQRDYLTVATMDTPSIRDLNWWIQEMKYNCSRNICTLQPDVLISTDSSDFAWGAIQSQVKILGLWRENQQDWHISVKEVMAAFLALQLLVPNHWDGHIQLSLDNTTAVTYLNHQGGTTSVQLSALVTGMWHWCLEWNILLSAVHIPGLKNLFADPLSHLKILSTE